MSEEFNLGTILKYLPAMLISFIAGSSSGSSGNHFYEIGDNLMVTLLFLITMIFTQKIIIAAIPQVLFYNDIYEERGGKTNE